MPARSQRNGSGEAAPTAADADEEEGSGSGDGRTGPAAPKDPKARAAWLRDRLTAAIGSRPGLAKVKLAFAAQDLSTGQDLGSHDAERGMTIASNAKLLTS